LVGGANVYLTSAELAAAGAIMGKLPTPAEYMVYAKQIDTTAADTYRYLNFHKMEQYTNKAEQVIVQQAV
jgi:aconitate hydratase 2/2-methylisocitrate dehydratase